VLSFFALIIYGIDYYSTPINERFFHQKHQILNPSGSFGHLFGIVGSTLIFLGVSIYVIRKRWRKLSRLGYLKYWLEFHIFLCSFGSVLVLFHTAFKFGGIISIGFWSLVTVVISGIIGRFIYVQIPRTLQGEKVTLAELQKEFVETTNRISEEFNLDVRSKLNSSYENLNVSLQKSGFFNNVKLIIDELKQRKQILNQMKINLKDSEKLETSEKEQLMNQVRNILKLKSKIKLYYIIEFLFKQWHIFHLPFAFTMFFLLILHIIITMIFSVN
jgi:hypothetical protein